MNDEFRQFFKKRREFLKKYPFLAKDRRCMEYLNCDMKYFKQIEEVFSIINSNEEQSKYEFLKCYDFKRIIEAFNDYKAIKKYKNILDVFQKTDKKTSFNFYIIAKAFYFYDFSSEVVKEFDSLDIKDGDSFYHLMRSFHFYNSLKNRFQRMIKKILYIS